MESVYHYEVMEVLAESLPADPKKCFERTEYFKGPNLADLAEKARAYYAQRQSGIENRESFFEKKFAGYKDFETGVNAYYSIGLYLVEESFDGETFYHVLAGEEEEDCLEGLELEASLLGKPIE